MACGHKLPNCGPRWNELPLLVPTGTHYLGEILNATPTHQPITHLLRGGPWKIFVLRLHTCCDQMSAGRAQAHGEVTLVLGTCGFLSERVFTFTEEASILPVFKNYCTDIPITFYAPLLLLS